MLETTMPLYHQLADQIHELIRAGTLRAGDRVPSVRRLSNQQRVSVSTVLQAYQRLEDIGVIEARPQSGYYVRRLSAGVQEPEPSRPPKRAITVEVNDLTDAVLAHASNPDVIAFGSACAAPELFQLERVRRVLSALARRDRDALGRYGLPPGTAAPRGRAPGARLGLPHRLAQPRHHHRLHGGAQPGVARRDPARGPGT
jgi:DNA-binding transcriptional MocR family regulator